MYEKILFNCHSVEINLIDRMCNMNCFQRILKPSFLFFLAFCFVLVFFGAMSYIIEETSV